MNFYVYAHFDDRGIIFYIGKGQGDRAYNGVAGGIKRRSQYWCRHVEKYCAAGKPSVTILFSDMPESIALATEKKWIGMLGRSNLNRGQLVNLTDGGEGVSGRVYSESTRKKMSDKAKIRGCQVRGWNKGIKSSDQTRSKLSLSHMGQKSWNKGLKTGIVAYNRRTILCHQNGKIYEAITHAADDLNLNSQLINKVLAGERKHTKNYTFQYIGEP
jgi:hypothetical protein